MNKTQLPAYTGGTLNPGNKLSNVNMALAKKSHEKVLGLIETWKKFGWEK